MPASGAADGTGAEYAGEEFAAGGIPAGREGSFQGERQMDSPDGDSFAGRCRTLCDWPRGRREDPGKGDALRGYILDFQKKYIQKL